MARHDVVGRFLGGLDFAQFGDPLAEIGLFDDCGSSAELREAFRVEVATEVSRVLALVEDADAFDVIELMRLRELPLVAGMEHDGTALNVEVVAAAMLGRASRKPSGVPRRDTRPPSVQVTTRTSPDWGRRMPMCSTSTSRWSVRSGGVVTAGRVQRGPGRG